MEAQTKELPKNIVNPFSDEFVSMWNIWKQYKWEEFKFKYKGCLSEQAALMKLNDLSCHVEEVAVEIIKQSMANGWKGFFELKNKGNGNTKENTRQSVSEQFAGRNYANRRP
jgi:hypothetical protein